MIASPPNLIVSQQLVDNGFEKLGFFEITPIGIIGVIVGIFYLYAVRNILFPNEKGRNESRGEHQLSPSQLAYDYQLGGNLFTVSVPADSEMIGKRLAQLKIPGDYQLCILKIERKSTEGLNLLPMTYQEMAGPKSIIQAKDVLHIQGSSANWRNWSKIMDSSSKKGKR